MNGNWMIPLLTDQENQEFCRLLLFYWHEAHRCRDSKAYLAGAVMTGALLETSLMLMVDTFEEEAVNTGELPKRKNGDIKPLMSWTLNELLIVAKAAKWIPNSIYSKKWKMCIKKGTIGDYADFVHTARNLLHPAKYTREHSRKRFTKRHLNMALGSIILINRKLNNKLDRRFPKIHLASLESL